MARILWGPGGQRLENPSVRRAREVRDKEGYRKNLIENEVRNLVSGNIEEFDYLNQFKDIMSEGGEALIDTEFFNRDDLDHIRGLRDRYLLGDPPQNDLSIYQTPARKAGDVVTDDLLNDIKQLADEQVKTEMFEENMRQLGVVESIHGRKETAAMLDPTNPSKSVEQQVGRQLVMNGVAPASIPADRVLGSAVSNPQLGIDGTFKPDSEVRRHVTGGIDADGNLNLDRTDVRTELLSPRGRREAYRDWAQNAFGNQTGMVHFNSAAAEYYGQQALKLMGNKPVPDSQRAQNTLIAADSGNTASTVGTDRLVENSVKLSDPDVDLSADFRYLTPEGKVMVGDNQVSRINDDGSMNFNVLKKSNLKPEKLKRVKNEMVQIAQDLEREGIPPNLDLIMGRMMRSGTLAEPTLTGRDNTTRAGKFMSSGTIVGQKNLDDQYKYDKVLYPIYDKGDLYEDEGYLPKSFRLFDTNKTRRYAGKALAKGGDDINLFMHNGNNGDLQMSIVTPDNPDGKLGRDLNNQFREGYSF